MARATSYKAEYVDLVYKYALLGATDDVIAGYFGITRQGMDKWRARYPDFAKALLDGKARADAEVAHSLYRRALGYSHPETVIKSDKYGIHEVEVTKHYAPDTVACIFILKNRHRAQWRDKQEIEHSGEVKYKDLTDDQLAAQIKQLQKEQS